jgi:hypothetical protein
MNSRNYFLSPTNLFLNNIFNLNACINSDNIIGQGNLKNILFISYNNNSNKIRIQTTNSRQSFDSYVLNKNILLAYDMNNEQLIGYNLNELKPFNKIEFQINIDKSLIQTFGLSQDCKYVYIIEKRTTLKFYRLIDCKKIAETLLYSLVRDVTCSDEFISLSMQDKRVISFLIVDPLVPNSSDKIKSLESRSNVGLNDKVLRDPSQYFEKSDQIINYTEVFKTKQEADKIKRKFDEMRKSKL